MSIEGERGRPLGPDSATKTKKPSSDRKEEGGPETPAPELPPQSEPSPSHPTLGDRNRESTLDTASRILRDSGASLSEKLSEKIPHSFIGDIGSALQRAQLNLLNKPTLALFEKMYRRQSEKAAKSEAVYLDKDSAVKGFEARLTKLDESSEKVRAGGLYNPKTAAKIERERNVLLQQIEKAKTAKDAAHVTLESRNNKKAYWENKQKNLANEVIDKVEEKARPYIEMSEATKTGEKELVTRMESLKKIREAGQQGLKEYRAQIKSKNIDAGERALLQIKIDGIKDCIKRIDLEYKSKNKERFAINEKKIAANTRLGKWNTFTNQYTRVGSRDRRYANPGLQEKVASGPDREYTFSHAPEDAAPAPDPTVPPETPVEKEPILETTPNEYAKRWNNLYGREFSLSADMFSKARHLDPGQKLTFVQIENQLQAYFKKIQPGGKLLYTPAAVQKRARKIRETFK